MKHRITPEQLNELSDEQKERLRVWWKPQQGDYAYVVSEYKRTNRKTGIITIVTD
jgi:spore germination protein GerM